jgi:hypothetical protein
MNIYNKNDNVESQQEQEQEQEQEQKNIKNQFSYKRLISYVVASVLILSVSIAYISSSSLSSSSSSSSIKSTTGRQLLSDKIDSQGENVQRTLSKKSSKKSEDTEEKSAPTPSKDYTLPTLPTIYIPTIWSPSPYPSFKPTGNYYS